MAQNDQEQPPVVDDGFASPTLGEFCPACQAIPAAGYCKLAGCPMPLPRNGPVNDWAAMLALTADDLESSQTDKDLAWLSALGRPASMTRIALARDIRCALAEVKRCHEVIGGFMISFAYADTLPDDAEDATDMKFGQHYWEGAATSWAGDDLLAQAHEAAKERMRDENPAQVRDLDWTRAMEDVVASGGLPERTPLDDGGDKPSTTQTDGDPASELNLLARAEAAEARLTNADQEAQALMRQQLALQEEITRLRERLAEVEAKLNTPELHNFARGVTLEAAHQRERWGVDHDAGKSNEDWFWLVGYLTGKVLHAAKNGDDRKALHHTISTAAALVGETA